MGIWGRVVRPELMLPDHIAQGLSYNYLLFQIKTLAHHILMEASH